MESHNKSKVFFIVIKPENSANKDLLEVEIEQVSKNKAQTLNNGPDFELFDDYRFSINVMD